MYCLDLDAFCSSSGCGTGEDEAASKFDIGRDGCADRVKAGLSSIGASSVTEVLDEEAFACPVDNWRRDGRFKGWMMLPILLRPLLKKRDLFLGGGLSSSMLMKT